MKFDAELERRRERLQALVDHPDFAGNKTAMGVALGYKDGAFVGQMLRGARPVSEKTIAHIHTMKGARYAGWFSSSGEAAPKDDAPPWPFLRIRPEFWASLSPQDQGVAEDAAVAKLKELAAERAALSGKQSPLVA